MGKSLLHTDDDQWNQPCFCRGCRTLKKFNVLQNFLFQTRMFLRTSNNREQVELATVTFSLEQESKNKAGI